MGRSLTIFVALTLAACRMVGSTATPTPVGCEIVVTHSADGRSGTVGCASPSLTPRVAGTQEPPKGKDKGKGHD